MGKKTIAVVESLSTTSTRCSVTENSSLLQELSVAPGCERRGFESHLVPIFIS